MTRRRKRKKKHMFAELSHGFGVENGELVVEDIVTIKGKRRKL